MNWGEKSKAKKSKLGRPLQLFSHAVNSAVGYFQFHRLLRPAAAARSRISIHLCSLRHSRVDVVLTTSCRCQTNLSPISPPQASKQVTTPHLSGGRGPRPVPAKTADLTADKLRRTCVSDRTLFLELPTPTGRLGLCTCVVPATPWPMTQCAITNHRSHLMHYQNTSSIENILCTCLLSDYSV